MITVILKGEKDSVLRFLGILKEIIGEDFFDKYYEIKTDLSSLPEQSEVKFTSTDIEFNEKWFLDERARNIYIIIRNDNGVNKFEQVKLKGTVRFIVHPPKSSCNYELKEVEALSDLKPLSDFDTLELWETKNNYRKTGDDS